MNVPSSLDALSGAHLIRLGEGGFGSTYRVSSAGGKRPVVLKLMPAGGLRARLGVRFTREMATIGALSHQRDMVTLHSWGQTPDERWWVMLEEAPGGSLAELVDASEPLDWRSVIQLGIRLAGVLAVAHDLGIVHRDIKPANILLSMSGRPMLTDMGLGSLGCSFSLEGPAAVESLTCAAPEAAHTMALTPASDIYALAATLRLLLQPGAGARLRREPPPGLIEVLEAATAPRPEDRYPSMAALGHDLELLAERRRRTLRIALPPTRRVA